MKPRGRAPAGWGGAKRGRGKVALTSYEIFESGMQPFRGCWLQQIGHCAVPCFVSPAAVTLPASSASSAHPGSKLHLVRTAGLLSGAPHATLTIGEGFSAPDYGA